MPTDIVHDFDSIPWWADAAVDGAVALVRLFASPASRTYWLFLAISLAIAIVITILERRRRVALPPHLDVFSRRTWFGRSAMNDYWIVLINGIAFGSAAQAFTPDIDGLALQMAEGIGLIIPALGEQTGAWAPIVLAAALFLADDFARYAIHWLEHRVPALWELHKVHHSAEVLNFITAERHHPISLFFAGVVIVSVAATVNGAFIWALGSHLTPTSLLGVNAFWIAANLLASSLRHSPVWLSFGPRVERWLISPAQHQVHHSQDERHFGKNLGGTLAVWDRLFGTLYVTTATRVPLTFGLGSETASLRTIPSLYLRPVLRALPRALRASFG